MFGDAVALGASNKFNTAKAGVTGMKAVASGAINSGSMLALGGQSALAAQQAGAKEAAAGAEYALASALRYRGGEDASLVAERQLALDQMRLQSQLEFQNFKKQQDYLRKQAEEDTTGGLKGVTDVTDLAVEAGVSMRTYMAEHPGATVDDLIKASVEGDSQLAADPNALRVLRQVALGVTRSTGDDGMTVKNFSREDEAGDILTAVLTLYPNYKKADQLEATILAALNAGWSAKSAAALAEAQAKSQRSGDMGHPGDFRGFGTSGADTGYNTNPSGAGGAYG
jgi:hypothetical protein